MQTFIEQVAEDILSRYELPRDEINLLFPNYRPALFLQKALARKSEVPIWSPELFTMDQLVEQYSEPVRADELTLIYQLFKTWRTIVDKEEQEPFNRFFFWGKSLLGDFDEVDKYLADSQALFHHIRDLRELEARFDNTEMLKELSPLWKSLLEEHSQTKQAFLNIWNNLFDVYSDFQDRLQREDIAYAGMLYRDLAEHPERLEEICELPIMIVGFNRLNRCEEVILKYLQEHAEVRFYWDTDPFITEFLKEDAGRYLDKHLKQFPPAQQIESSMEKEEKDITIRGVPLLAGQSQWVRKCLEDWNAGEETAVIIPDEQMLIPVLSSWPDEIDHLNISMGLPIRETPVFTLVEAFISLHESYRKDNGVYYYRWMEVLINHPYLPDVEKELNDALEQKEKEPWELLRKRIYLEPGELPLDNDLCGLLFEPLESNYEFFDRMLELIQYAYDQFGEAEQDDSFIREILLHSHGRMMRLRDIVREADMELTTDAILPLITELFRLTRIPFKGEPLEGTQVLGPLEARSLDFERIVIPAMNEGTFPPDSRESFIPYSMRKAFNLPTTDDHAAEYSYYFWTMLQRAKDVVLLYNTESGDMGQQERSRFIQQLLFLEFGQWNIQNEISALSAMSGDIPPFSVSKEAEEQKAVDQYLESGISPSALDTYLNCRLRFYLEHILGWKEEEDTMETIDAAMIGRLLHKTMELIYSGSTGSEQTVTEEQIDKLKSKIPQTIDRAIRELTELSGVLLERGLAMVYRDILKRYVDAIMEYDRSQAPFLLHTHEQSLENVPLPRTGSDESPVGIKGIIDRVDEQDGQVRVIDYKTGQVNLNIRSLSELFDRDSNHRNSAAMQTILYALALGQSPEFEHKSIQPALYSVRSITDESENGPAHKFTWNYQAFELGTEEREEFLNHFYTLIDEIRNPDIPFDQTDDWDRCTYCPFIHFCGREQA